MKIDVLCGTAKGAFRFRSTDRRTWSIDGPLFKGWKVTAFARLPTGEALLATAHEVYGAAIHKSRDLESWRQVERPPRFTEADGCKLNQVWTLVPAGDRVYAGVDEAGLFESDDGGETWRPNRALNEHATRGAWFPGYGGMCLHSILVDAQDPRRIWTGISAVGVFRSDDGGRSWTPKNDGVPTIMEDRQFKDIGRCVHSIVADPNEPDRIFRQDHRGVFRSDDGADSWQRIEDGLPSGYGFPLALDPRTQELYAVPQESDEYRLPEGGALVVWKSADGGARWHPLREGLPQHHAWASVLRKALVVDPLDPCGVYLGTTSGTVHVSADAGASWIQLPCTLPRVLALAAFVDG